MPGTVAAVVVARVPGEARALSGPRRLAARLAPAAVLAVVTARAAVAPAVLTAAAAAARTRPLAARAYRASSSSSMADHEQRDHSGCSKSQVASCGVRDHLH